VYSAADRDFFRDLYRGVAGLLLPESGVCGLQVPQRLLERDAGYLGEVAEVVGVFPLAQQGGGLEVETCSCRWCHAVVRAWRARFHTLRTQPKVRVSSAACSGVG